MERIVQGVSNPAITAGAYSTGKVIGGPLTFQNVVTRGYCAIYSVILLDKAGQNSAIDLFLFSSAVSGNANGATAAVSSADLQNCIGVIPIAAADYASVGTGSAAGKSGKLGLFMGAISDTTNDLYGLLICRGSPTYVSTSDITVKIWAELGIL